ncbi:aspartate aminotransferase family protein [Desulfurococcus mucosus]|uniref:aspartate aminotransferase family protein n=1 Tax=Desulfurococcus mucosus TaxID=2275 RepID=UPI000B291B36|nr:aspartate aminotransferase family protein [Desulfurococcus mucosus]
MVFGFSGSDAVDSSIKAARAYTGRKGVVSFLYSYHGMTYGALSATGIVGPSVKEAVHPMSEVVFAEYPDPYRNKWGVDGYERPVELANLALEEVEERVKEAGAAAIIFEPIQGDAGVVVPPAEFIKGLREIADKHGAVLVDEEVQAGMGRTGKWWAVEHFGVVPDLLVSAKALGGGMPISAVVGRAEILDSVPPPLFAFTHTGHSVCAAAAIATINAIKREGLVERAAILGDYALKRLTELKEKYHVIGDVRGRGLMIGVDIVKNPGTREPDKKTALKICWRAWEKGLILITFGKHSNVLRIAPPLNIPREDLDRGIDIIEESIKDVLEGRVPDEVLEFLRPW